MKCRYFCRLPLDISPVYLTRGISVINPVAFSYGYDHLRFIKPVFIGDTIHTKVTIKEKKDHKKRANMGFVTETLEIINQKGETVMVADHLLLCQKKNS